MPDLSEGAVPKCVKCTLPGEYSGLDARKAVYCKECFIKMVKHKFSYALGKNRVFRDGRSTDVLVAYTGDAASALLLSLVEQGINQDAHKRLQIYPSVLAVFSGNDKEQLLNEMDKCKQIAKRFPWRWHYVHMAALLDPSARYDSDSMVGLEKVDDLQQLLESLKSKSLKLEFDRLLRTLIIWRAAAELKIARVVVPDYAEALANASFNALCFGRSPSMGEMAKVVDRRHPRVELIRPLREVCEKEIRQINEFEGSDEYALRQETEAARYRPGEGIQPLTENFLSGLQTSGFPATVTTILSVSTKVEAREKGDCKDAICEFL
ncbi:Protein TUT-2 [Aphelenchoides avenae]|nr:Protein TUT-2 [Aphelenchus avenae]